MNAVSGRPNVASPKTGLSAGPLMTSNRKLYPSVPVALGHSLNYGFVQMTFVVGRLIFKDAYALWVLFTFAAKMLKVGQCAHAISKVKATKWGPCVDFWNTNISRTGRRSTLVTNKEYRTVGEKRSDRSETVLVLNVLWRQRKTEDKEQSYCFVIICLLLSLIPFFHFLRHLFTCTVHVTDAVSEFSSRWMVNQWWMD